MTLIAKFQDFFLQNQLENQWFKTIENHNAGATIKRLSLKFFKRRKKHLIKYISTLWHFYNKTNLISNVDERIGL